MVCQSQKCFSIVLSILALVAIGLLGDIPHVQAVSTNIVISQVYGGGGNTSAQYTNDFIELYNQGSTAINVTGWTVQYASSTGSSWQKTGLAGTIQPGKYYLVQEAVGNSCAGLPCGASLPTADATGTIPMSASAGKVALVNNSTTLTGTCPTGLVDFLGFGTATNCSETTPTANLSNTTAALRKSNGAQDTDNNSIDFIVGIPTPRNSGTDLAPTVISTLPGNGASLVALNVNVTVTFNEPVNVTGNWFTLVCTTSGQHTATVTGGPTTFTLDPDADFVLGDSCTLTIVASLVSDQDPVDPPDTLAANFVATFTTINICDLPFTPIPQIQGNGLTTPIPGTVTTQGVVIGDYEGASPALRGFFMQDPVGDGDSTTSDGIFVFESNNANNVALGDLVRVTGTAGENQGQTQIALTSFAKCGTGTITPTAITLPFASADFPERYEGMLVKFTQTLYVTEHFQLGRFDQVVMSSGARLKQPTNATTPGALALAMQAQNDLNRIIIDDAFNNQNPDPILFARSGNSLSASNTLRGGDTAANIVGVMTYTWAGNAASGNAYRVRPINALGGGVPNFQASNARPPNPNIANATLKVGAMNLLNFFNTFNDSNAATPGCFPSGTDADCRGANSSAEFDRQWAKTVAAMVGSGLDVIGVNELENDGYGSTSAIQFLVDKLNAATAAGTYAFIDVDTRTGQTNAMGTDAIKVGLIYKPGKVTPIGQTAVLNNVAFVNGGDSAPRNRATFAQAFEQNSNKARFVVNVNHLKSKGSACDDPDAGDGQGNCNVVRTNAVNTLTAWLATNPTGIGDPDILILGDMNSYAKEDPITAYINAGYTNLSQQFIGADAYSYVFDGQWGYLDHALGSSSLLNPSRPQIAGVVEWHVNSDEPSVLDYNVEFKSAGQITSLYAADQFRISDHDPIIVGLKLNGPPTVNAGGPYSVNESASVTVAATGNDPDGDALTYAWDLDNNGSFETPGPSVAFSAATIDGPASRTIKVRVTDAGGLMATAQATVNILNAAPVISANPATQNVQYSDSIAPVTIIVKDIQADLPPTSFVTAWKKSTDASYTSGLPTNLTLSAANCSTLGQCAWTLNGKAMLAPATYLVRVTATDKDGGSAYTDITFVIKQEDARVTYTGAVFASTSSVSTSTANVTLAATIQDITAVTADPAFDPDAGDIRNATLTFVNRDASNAVLCTAPIGLVNASDPKTGTATCTWVANIGTGDSVQFTVGIIVGNYYTRNASTDNTIVTLSKPLATEFITGGGYLTLTNSAGLKAGDAGSKNNFGFNVKYNKAGTNLQGNMNIIVRSGGRVYQIKGNAMTSLTTQPAPCVSVPCAATFNGKANIQDITDPNNPISVDGNAALQITLTDKGEPGSNDSIAITVWNKSGGLWFASKWDGAKTVEQVVAGGNLVVH